MIRIDSDSLECDLAETYGILNMKEHPASRIALFSSGLRENSRIISKILNRNVSCEQALLAATVDRLSMLVWMNSEDCKNGINRPSSLLDKLLNIETESDVVSFDSGEEFDNYYKTLVRGEGG